MQTLEIPDVIPDFHTFVPVVKKSAKSKSTVVTVPFALTAPVTEKTADGAFITTEKPLVSLFIEAKTQAEDWAAKQSLYGSRIKAAAEPLRIAEGQKVCGAVQTLDLGGLRYTAQEKFNAVDPDHFDEISRVFGEDYSAYLYTKTDFVLNQVSLELQRDDQNVRKAIWILMRMGVVTQVRTGHATERLFADLSIDPDVRAKAASVGLLPQCSLTVTKGGAK